MNRLFIMIAIMLTSMTKTAVAQSTEMADTMEAQGKINVVIVVAFLVLTIMSVWLMRIETRIGKLEKESASPNKAKQPL